MVSGALSRIALASSPPSASRRSAGTTRFTRPIEAPSIGLVNRVVPADRLEAEGGELASAIRDNAPLTIAACKAALREWRRDPAKRELAGVAKRVEACFRSGDYGEGQR